MEQKRAAIYVRVSTREQETLEDQKRRCAAFAEAKGWTVAPEHVYEDQISAWSGKDRPGWLRLERAVEQREVDVVVVFQVSRAARNVGRLHAFIETCREANVVFASTSEGVDTSTPMGRLMATIVGALAELESEIRSERVLLGMEKVREEKRWANGGAPFGYDYDPETKKLTVNKREAKAIKQGITTMLNEGSAVRGGAARRGAAQVARKWNAAGITTKARKKGAAGKRWNGGSVKRALTAERITGRLNGRKMGWKAIVTLRDWQRICDLFERNPKVGGSRSERYLLTGLMYCAVDGRKMVGRPNAKTRRYICLDERGRPHLAINAEAVEHHIKAESNDRRIPYPEVPEDPAADEALLADRDRIDAQLVDWGTRLAAGGENEQVARGAIRELERQAGELDAALESRPRGRFGRLLSDYEAFVEAYPTQRSRLDAQVDRITVSPAAPGFKRIDVEGRVEVTWSPEAREFTEEELAEGRGDRQSQPQP